MSDFKLCRALVLVAAATLATPLANAQAWPNKPVTIVVPFPPGGGTDAFARPLFALLSKNAGRQFISDPKGGAGGPLGGGRAARAAAAGCPGVMGGGEPPLAPRM